MCLTPWFSGKFTSAPRTVTRLSYGILHWITDKKSCWRRILTAAIATNHRAKFSLRMTCSTRDTSKRWTFLKSRGRGISRPWYIKNSPSGMDGG